MNQNTRPTMDMALAFIDTLTYTRLPSGTAIVCEVRMKNLHYVHGIATVVDMENDSVEAGKRAAYSKALDRVFDYVTFDLHSKMIDTTGHGPEIPNRNLELQEEYRARVLGKPVLLT